MEKIDEIFPIDITASIGPAGTIRRLFASREFFKSQGYDMTVFACFQVNKSRIYKKYELQEMLELPQMSSFPNMKKSDETILAKIRKVINNNKFFACVNMRYRKMRGNEHSVREYLKLQRQPDMVVFHDYMTAYNYLTMAENLCPSVVFLHSDGNNNSMFLKSYPKLKDTKIEEQHDRMFDYTIHHCDRIVFISQLARQRFVKLHPEINPENIFAVVNGIDDKPILYVTPSCNYRFRLCTSGTVSQRKGQYIIVEAMKQMNKEILKETHLTIMGIGPDYERLIEMVNEAELQNHVTFLGNVPNPEMHKKLSAENIYCLMSNNEGLPIAIIEAMRAGLPVISTKVAGIPEQVDKRNGILINPDINELVEILNNLPKYDWNNLGIMSRQRFETEFTFKRMLNDYTNIFKGMNH